MLPSVSVVIINYKTIELTKKAIKSIYNFYQNIPMLVIDNGSKNESRNQLKEIANKIQNLFKKAISLKPDYIQFYDSLHIDQAAKVRKNGIKVILNLSESYPEMYRGFSRKSKLIGEIMALYISKKEKKWAFYWDDIIVTDNSLYKRFIQLRDDVCLIHLYPPLHLFNKKNTYTLPQNTFRLVYVGQIRKERGIFQLIHAISLLIRESKKVKPDLIGPFSYDWKKKNIRFNIYPFS